MWNISALFFPFEILRSCAKSLPLKDVQASFGLLCFSSSSWDMSIIFPLTPVRSWPLWPNRIQSIRECPGFSTTLLRGFNVFEDCILCGELAAGNCGPRNCWLAILSSFSDSAQLQEGELTFAFRHPKSEELSNWK